jgi:putative methyltransferase (TIGR04325 family)
MAIKHLVASAARRMIRRCGYGLPVEWEFLASGWPEMSPTEGWHHASIAITGVRKWQSFTALATGTGPLGIAHEAATPTNRDYDAHHLVMTFGYVLAVAARGRDVVSVLDWGSGLGHYVVLARQLLPDVDFGFTCVDLPELCARGRRLVPQARFVEETELVAGETFDLVVASGSLQCVEDWKAAAGALAGAAGSYLYITRLPIVSKAASFVVQQRPNRYGYTTAYPAWFFNGAELVDAVTASGLRLIREFVFQRHAYVWHAPEQAEVCGFLFRRDAGV